MSFIFEEYDDSREARSENRRQSSFCINAPETFQLLKIEKTGKETEKSLLLVSKWADHDIEFWFPKKGLVAPHRDMFNSNWWQDLARRKIIEIYRSKFSV